MKIDKRTKFYKEFVKECQNEENYKKTYVPEDIQVGDEVRIMTPMLGNGQFGVVTECREFPKRAWDSKKDDWVIVGIQKAYVVKIPKGNQFQFNAEQVKKVS